MARGVPQLIGDNPETRRFLDELARDIAALQGTGSDPDAATAFLNIFTDTLKGLAPASGGGTVNFLRADGTWQPSSEALTGDATKSAGSSVVTLVKASSAFSFTGVISPAQITTNQDDYSPTGIGTATWVRFNTDASRNINSVNANTNTVGRMIIWTNVGAQNGVFVHEAATGTASMKFNFTSSVNKTVAPNSSLWTIYDATTSRWRNLSFV